MNSRAPKIYCLQCDVSKYFDSINHQILFSLLKKKIADQKVLWLIKVIIESSNKEFGSGIPIGNLTSQLFANVYLNELDQFVKHKLLIKHYIRYMDDFLILDFEKKKLHQIKSEIQEFLRNKLKLGLHPKKANIFQQIKVLISSAIRFLSPTLRVVDPEGESTAFCAKALLKDLSREQKFIKK